MKKILGLFLLMGMSAFSKDLTLDEAIDLSLENSKNIAIASKNKNIGGLNLLRAFKYALPTVAYQGTYNVSEHTKRDVIESYDNFGNKIETKSKDGYSNQIVITYPIFQGGATIGGIKGAKAQRNILDYTFLQEKSNVRINTITLYSNILTYEKNLEALEASKKELNARYVLQGEKLKSRLIIKSDLLNTEYALLQVESEIIRVKNLIKTEERKLAIEIGLENIEEDLNLAPLYIPSDLSKNIDIEKDMTIAKTESLNALISLNNLEYSKAEKMVAFSDNLPKVNIFASYGGTEKLHSSDVFDDEEWRGGVSVNWEFFSFGSGIDTYKVASENYDIEELNNSIVQDNIEINLLTAYSEVLRLEKFRQANKASLEAAFESFEIDKKRYEAGLLSTEDYLNSEAQYTEAQVNYNNSESSYLVAFEKYRAMLI